MRQGALLLPCCTALCSRGLCHKQGHAQIASLAAFPFWLLSSELNLVQEMYFLALADAFTVLLAGAWSTGSSWLVPPGSSQASYQQALPSHINPLSSYWNSLCSPPPPKHSSLVIDLHLEAWFPKLVYTSIAAGSSSSSRPCTLCMNRKRWSSAQTVSVTCEVSGMQLVWEILIKTIPVLQHWSSVAGCRELRCHGSASQSSAVSSHSWCQSSRYSLLFLNPFNKFRNRWHLSCTSLGMQVMDLMTAQGDFKSGRGNGEAQTQNFARILAA